MKDKHQWIQADLGVPHLLESVTTLGRLGRYRQWVKSYYISYSHDRMNWVNIPTLYSGNVDQDTEKTNNLPPNIVARYVRLRPNTWNQAIAMRWEVAGCSGKLALSYHSNTE